MTDRPTTRARPRWLRRLAVTASAATVLALAPVGAGAQSFIDPDDPCLPGADAPPAPASDRAEISAVHVANVDCAYALGIALGRTDGTYMPKIGTRRDQMAAFIVRSLEAAGYPLPAPTDQGFGDIAGNVHEDDINILADIGVTEGVTADRYVPGDLVPRDQMASFIVRAAEFAYSGDPVDPDNPDELDAVGSDFFTDVPDTNVHKENIEAGFEVVGLVQGVTGDEFRPRQITTREQMATFLIRLVDMTLLVE